MADETTIVYKIELNRPEAEEALKSVTGAVVNLKNQNTILTDAIKNLSKAEGDHTATIKGATKEIELNKQKISENAAQQKALVSVINAESGSINALRAQNKLLLAERNNLNASTETGKQRIDQINKSLDANNLNIQQNSSGLEKQRLNIGNYSSALSGVVPGLGGMVNGLQAATVAGKAFIATPLGLVIGAIGLALAPLISYLTSTGEGIDRVARESAGFSSALQVLKDRLNDIGRGEAGAANEAAQGIMAANKATLTFIKTIGSAFLAPFQKVIDKYNDAAEVGRTYADRVDEIADAEENYGIVAARTENQIKRLILESKNRTLSETERIAKIDEASKLESDLVVQRTEFAKDELSALVELNRERLKNQGIIQTSEETQSQFIENNINLIRDLDEELATSLIESLKKIEQVTGDSIAIEEKLQNQRDALLDKAATNAQKRREDEAKAKAKQLEDDKKAEEENYQYYVDLEKERRDKAEADRIEQVRIENEQEANNQAVRKANREKDLAEQKKYTDTVKALKRSEASAGRDAANAAAALAKEGSAAQKALALTAIAVNTGIGISNAAASAKGIPFPANLAAIFTSIAVTLAGISQARNALRAERGMIIPKNRYNYGGVLRGPSHAEGGIPFTVGGRSGFEAEGDEILINKKSSRMFRKELSAINSFNGNGVKFESGGIVGVSNISRASESRASQRELFEAISRIRPVVTVEDINREQYNVAVVESNAIVQ